MQSIPPYPSRIQEYETLVSKQVFPVWIDVEDLLDIIEYYEREHKEYEAENAMRVALRMHPDNPQVKLHQACRLKTYGRWTEALALVATLENQEDIDVLFFYAEKALSELNPNLAGHYIEQIFAHLSIDFDETARIDGIRQDIGNLYLDYGFSDLALSFYSQVSETSPEYPKTLMSIAEICFQQGNVREAERQINKVLDQDPYNIEAWVLMADIAYEAQNFDLCIEASDYALVIDRSNQRALRFRTFAALEKKDFDTVLNLYDTYRQNYPDDYSIAISVGEIYVKRGNYPKGIEVLAIANRCCPNDNPDKVRILTDIATAYAGLKQMPRAHEILLGACSLGSKHSDVILQTIALALDTCDYDYCDKFAADYLTANPQVPAEFVHQLVVFIDAASAWHYLPETSRQLSARLQQ